MPDNWSFVAAAYGLTAAVLFVYWRRLAKKEREVTMRERSNASRSRLTAERSRLTAERSGSTAERSGLSAERSQEPSRTGHPRRDPDSRHSLQ